MLAPLLLASLVAGQPTADDAMFTAPAPDSLRRVFGVRYKRDYGSFELLQTNQEEWTVPRISDDGARVYVGTRSGVLEALDLFSGEVLWTRRDMGTLGWGLSEFRGYLVLGSDANLVAVDQQIGRDHWKVDLGGRVSAPLTVTGTVALVPIRPNNLLAVDLVEGKVLWRFGRPTPDGISVRGQCSPTVDEARGQVYMGFSDGTLVALSLKDGTTQWVSTLGKRKDFFPDVDATPLLTTDGKGLIAASYNGGLFELDPDTGERRWAQPVERIFALTRVEPGLIAASLGNGQVVGLYEANGKVRWRYRAKSGYPTKAVDVGNGKLVFGTSRGPITVLETQTGRPVQLIDPGSGLSVAPAHRSPDLVALSNKGLLLVMRYGEGVGISGR